MLPIHSNEELNDLNFETGLPVEPFLPQIVKFLQHCRRLVIHAPAGAGKSTLVPLALPGQIIMLQPRRVAAKAVARRMSHLLGEPVGQSVGYHIRHDRKASKKTRILVITEGMLNRYLVSDPFLEQANTIILDEFHERSLHADLALSLVKTIQEVREDLNLVVMSATLDVEALTQYLDQPPVIHIPVRQFPLNIQYRSRSVNEPFENAIVEALFELKETGNKGDILVFLQGAYAVNKAVSAIRSSSLDLEALPFYSAMSSVDQEKVFNPGPKQRVVCATNIAETSLTIPRIAAVIDSGWFKVDFFDPSSGTSILKEARISKASADQRAGRAGRLCPGTVYRLWSQEDHASRKDFDAPEISRSDFSAALLAIINHHGPDLTTFPFFERPPETLLSHAMELMGLIQALDTKYQLTPLGKEILKLPLSPRDAAILASAGDEKYTACLLCALIDQGAGLVENKSAAGLLDQLHLLEGSSSNDQWAGEFRLNQERLRQARRTFQHLVSEGKRIWDETTWKNPLPTDEKSLIPLLMAGYPDRLGTITDDGKSAILASGRHVEFRHPIKRKEFALAVFLQSSAKGRSSNHIVNLAVGLNWGILQETGAGNLRKTTETWFDEEKKQVVCREKWVYGSRLTVRLGAYMEAGLEEKAQALGTRVLNQFEREFKPGEKAQAFMWRLRFAKKYLLNVHWPDVESESIRLAVPEVCLKICREGQPTLDSFHNFDWLGFWKSKLDWPTLQLLEKEVPASILTPNGKRACFDYEPEFGVEGRPVFSGILQNLFGMNQAPRLAHGQVAPLVHILGPHGRPVQVTSDLSGFWSGSYHLVRKELKGRYPRHDWPETP